MKLASLFVTHVMLTTPAGGFSCGQDQAVTSEMQGSDAETAFGGATFAVPAPLTVDWLA